jgi:hypothetical protein
LTARPIAGIMAIEAQLEGFEDLAEVAYPPVSSGKVTMSIRTLSARDDSHADDSSSGRDLELDQVRKAVKGIRFGEVRLIIQDGLIVQIERVEKQRLR